MRDGFCDLWESAGLSEAFKSCVEEQNIWEAIERCGGGVPGAGAAIPTPRQIAEACYERSQIHPPLEHLGKWKVTAAFRVDVLSDLSKFSQDLEAALSSGTEGSGGNLILVVQDPGSDADGGGTQGSTEVVLIYDEVTRVAPEGIRDEPRSTGDNPASGIHERFGTSFRDRFGGRFLQIVSVEKFELGKEMQGFLIDLSSLLEGIRPEVRRCLTGSL
jgi:hypothetical protein